MIKHKLTVGQVLFVPPGRYSNAGAKPRNVVVAKVGRKWAELQGSAGRIDITADAMRIDDAGRGTGEIVYLSKAEWVKQVDLRCAWGTMAKLIGGTYGTPPAGVAITDIEAAMIRLNLKSNVKD